MDFCVFQPFVELAFQGAVLETLMELVVHDATLVMRIAIFFMQSFPIFEISCCEIMQSLFLSFHIVWISLLLRRIKLASSGSNLHTVLIDYNYLLHMYFPTCISISYVHNYIYNLLIVYFAVWTNSCVELSVAHNAL